MPKFTVKTKVNQIQRDKNGAFTYDQELVSIHWPATEEEEKKEKGEEVCNPDGTSSEWYY